MINTERDRKIGNKGYKINKYNDKYDLINICSKNISTESPTSNNMGYARI